MDSLQRRFATLDDISVNNILFANRDVYSKLNQGDIFDEMIKDIPEDIKKYSRVQEIAVNDFVNNVLNGTIIFLGLTLEILLIL